MIKKDNLDQFLFLYANAENIPFTNGEDALVKNYGALDAPFTNYSDSIIGWYDLLKIEISENLLSLPVDERLFYLPFVQDKLKFETSEFDEKSLIDILDAYDVNSEDLDLNKNKPLNLLLHKSFKSVSGVENLYKLRELHREYYKYLLNIERNRIIGCVNGLIDSLHSEDESTGDSYKSEIWFKVGVLFASGRMNKYYSINDRSETSIKPAYTAPRIAEELGDIRYNKYILGTINNYKGDKNIFYKRDKMLKIIAHCEKEKIPVIAYFKGRIPPE